MVAKVTYGASVYGAVSYNHNKVDEGTAKIIHTHNMLSNTNGEPLSFSRILSSFEDYLSANRRTKTPVAHFSLNPAIEDRLTEDKLKMLAEEYMEGMGYGNQPYIVYKHNDIDREHIHIVSVRIDETGAKISDSYDYLASMNLCRELELKYSLKQIPDEQKEDRTFYLKKIDYGKGDIKRQLSNILKTVTKDYKFQSFGELNALLSCFNVHSKIVRGEEDGNLYHGIVYSVTNDRGEPVGNPVKSSSISKSSGYEALEKLLNRESKKITQEEIDSAQIKSTVSAAMRDSRGKEAFVRNLKKENIDVVFRQNESGRIYGVTFIDHKHRLVLNGSRLGKEFSANIFNDSFNNAHTQQGPVSKDTETAVYADSIAPDTSGYIQGIPLDDIFGVFYSPPGADREEGFPENKRKKKKKRRGKNL